MSAHGTAALAGWLAQAHRSGLACRPDAGDAPRTVADAYAVQERVLAELGFGARPVAWKVSPPAPGRDLMASPVPSQPLRSPARIEAGTRTILGVEAEICFRFAADPPPAAGVADVRAAVDEMAVLIELCETRLADWAGAPALWKLADFQSHGAFVVGSGTRDFSRDFTRQPVELRVGDGAPVVATGSHPSGDLWAMVAWAVQHCAGRGMALRAGDIVTTGAWTGIAAISPGEAAVARFPGIGEARLVLA